MAMIRSGPSPAARQADRDASIGRTRAQTRRANPGRAAYFASSLLPVVRRMFPSVPASQFTAASVSGKYTAPSGRASASRSRRRYSTPALRQAWAMFSVTSAA